MSEEVSQTDKPPETIGRYRVKFELGRGGMSTVYACFDPRFERKVAVKVLPRALLHEESFRERFVREAKMVASLGHPCIVPVHDFGEEDGLPYLVMRLMPGGSLAMRISSQGALTLAEIEPILRRVNSALTAAHDQSIIHRDMKPDNILFDNYGNAYLSDFGIARLASNVQSNLTNTGGAVGTPGYMSPEQIQGKPVDNRSDIYALGILLFEMLSGQKPFQANTPAMVIVKQMTEVVPNICDLRPELPLAYDALVRRLTATSRENRPTTAVEVTQIVQRLLQNPDASRDAALPPAPAPAPSPKQSTQPTRQNHPPPPILPEIFAEPNALILSRQSTYQEQATDTFFSCPHCYNLVRANDARHDAQCPHCQTRLPFESHLCPYCNTYHALPSGLCDNCGAAMTRVCTNCHHTNWAGQERCQECRTSLDIFENLRQHDRRVAQQKRRQRLTAARQASQTTSRHSRERPLPTTATPSFVEQNWLLILFALIILLILSAIAYIALFA